MWRPQCNAFYHIISPPMVVTVFSLLFGVADKSFEVADRAIHGTYDGGV